MIIRPHRAKPLYERQELLCSKEVTSESERVHNHLTANFHLGNKKALFYNLKEYYELTGGNLFRVIPLTFHIKKGTKDPQYKRFIAYHKKRQAHVKKQEK